MPRDLFGDVIDPSIKVGSRKWYTVPLSLAVHTLVLSMLVVVPLLATGVLPMPHSSEMFMAVLPPPLPVPPAVRPAPVDTKPPANPDAAPIEPPRGIAAEPDVAFEDPAAVAGGIDPLLGNVVPGAGLVEPPPAPSPTPQAPVPVGGEVRQPQRVHYVAPVYPPIAQAARVQGMVIIEAIIGADGRVQDARVLRSRPMLDEAALAAVRQWTYTPTLLNGVPVPVIMTVTVHFTLR